MRTCSAFKGRPYSFRRRFSTGRIKEIQVLDDPSADRRKKVLFVDSDAFGAKLRMSEAELTKIAKTVLEMVPGGKGASFSFSPYAGCDCGCSPGFRLSNFNGSGDVYVTLRERGEVKDWYTGRAIDGRTKFSGSRR